MVQISKKVMRIKNVETWRRKNVETLRRGVFERLSVNPAGGRLAKIENDVIF
jgi:hypothetical protein